MTPDTLLARLSALGFTFSLGADGLPAFTPPAGSPSPERDALLCDLARAWAEQRQVLSR